MTLKRISALLLAAMLLFAGTACNGGNKKEPVNDGGVSTEAESGETVTKPAGTEDLGEFTWVKVDYGASQSTPEEDKMVLEEINKKMLEQRNQKIDIKVEFIPNAAYLEKLSVKLASKDAVDCFDMWYASYNTFVSKPGLVMPIDDLLDQYGQSIKERMPEQNWSNVSTDGKIMGIPNCEPYMAYVALYRKDWAQKGGITKVPETLEDVEALFEVYKNMGKIAYTAPMYHMDRWVGASYNIPSASYFDEEKELILDKFFHENYDDYAETLSRWNSKGYLPSDFLSTGWDIGEQNFRSSKQGALVTYHMSPAGFLKDLKTVDPNNEIAVLPYFSTTVSTPAVAAEASTTGVTFIMQKAKNAKAVISYFDWVLSDYNNILIASNGVNGIHYKKDDTAKTLENPLGEYKKAEMKKYSGLYGTMSYSGCIPEASEFAPVLETQLEKDADNFNREARAYLDGVKEVNYSPSLTFPYAESENARKILTVYNEQKDVVFANYCTGKITKEQFNAERDKLFEMYKPVAEEMTKFVNDVKAK